MKTSSVKVALIITALLGLPLAGQKKVSASSEQDWGLRRVKFSTPRGEVRVSVPNDIRPGDTLSGTVVADPSGKSDKQRRKNGDRLKGYVVETEKQRAPVGTQALKWTVPAGASGAAYFILRNKKGRQLARASLPALSPDAIPAAARPEQFRFPRIGQAGRPITMEGPFDGDFSSSSVKVAGTGAALLAESPRSLVVVSPPDTAGPSEIELIEGSTRIQSPYRSIAPALSADKMSLRRGESTTLVVEVEGLQGLPEDEPVSLTLVNETPRIVRMEGGDRQVLVIGSGEVDARGAHRRSITLTGVQPGSFSISTRVLAGVPRVLATIPPGFRRDPDNEDRVIPDDSELDPDEDEIGPLRFREDGLESPQFPGVPSNTARWQHREEPEKHELSDDTTAWWQKIHVQSYNRTGSDGVSRLTRGGEMLLHLKYSGDCEDGRWIQLIRSTT